VIPDFRWRFSVALVLEYESTAKKQCAALNLPESIVDDIIDIICAVGRQTKVHYRWRPHLQDAGDDFVLELAVSGDCEFIVTYNLRDFQGADQFGISVVTPVEFLAIIEETT
jgi:predicted nucleic acid-binding protein